MSEAHRPRIVILSSSLLTDRMFLYSGCLSALDGRADVEIWATSARNGEHEDNWKRCPARVLPYPSVRSYREFPHNYLRRVNERAWDVTLRPVSRLSMDRRTGYGRRNARIVTARALGTAVGALRLHQVAERALERLLRAYPRSTEAEERFRTGRPDLVVTTGPFWFDEFGVAARARALGIPAVAMIPSWDNVTTKNRMVFRYDGFLVWSEQNRRELCRYYPYVEESRVIVTGAAQFDVFRQERFHETREEFCRRHALRPDLPILVYAIGSPHFIRGEHHGALSLARRIVRGELGNVQMIVRPHPTKDNAELQEQFAEFAPSVVVQKVATPGTGVNQRSQNEEQVRDWVNTFRHADVVINLASTVSVDAALFDKPVVNVDFDPEPGAPNQQLIRDVNHLWEHFKPVAESGGVWLVNNLDEMVEAVRAYLKDPSLHRNERRWIAEHVCGYTDGRCGERLAEGLLSLARQLSRKEECVR